jgi:4-aminobutyrate aminotransferase
MSRPIEAVDLTVVPAVWSRYTDIIVDHGAGAWLFDVTGRRFLDFSSGIGVTSTGHAHPRVVEAITAQAARLIHGQQNIVYHQPGLALHDRLRKTLPNGPWQAFLSNSGAEAVEAAVKVARVATGRPVIIAFRGGFHGRTAQTMALSSSRHTIRGDFEPLPGSVYHAAFPYCYRGPSGSHEPAACVCDWEPQLEALFTQVVPPSKVAAFVVEPVLGEGGYVVPPRTFLPRLREIASAHGILLVVDEIQTGVGRTGKFWAVEHVGVTPDILVFAKGIASGLPLSGILARPDALASLAPGAHGGTYGGNVVACAAAIATLDVIEEEGLVVNAQTRGRQLLHGLCAIASGRSDVGEVRGLGLMIGVEFVRPNGDHPRAPNPDLAKRVLAALLERGLIALLAGSWGQVVRMAPPLVTTKAEVDDALRIFADALQASSAG